MQLFPNLSYLSTEPLPTLLFWQILRSEGVMVKLTVIAGLPHLYVCIGIAFVLACQSVNTHSPASVELDYVCFKIPVLGSVLLRLHQQSIAGFLQGELGDECHLRKCHSDFRGSRQNSSNGHEKACSKPYCTPLSKGGTSATNSKLEQRPSVGHLGSFGR